MIIVNVTHVLFCFLEQVFIRLGFCLLKVDICPLVHNQNINKGYGLALIIIIIMGSYNAQLIYPVGYSRRCCGATAALIRQPQNHPHNEEPEIRNRILWEGVRFLGFFIDQYSIVMKWDTYIYSAKSPLSMCCITFQRRTCKRKCYALGQGVNRQGFNFKLAMVKMCSAWPLLNKYARQKNFEVGLQIPPSPQTPYIAYGKGKKIENVNFVFAMVKMHSQQPKRNYYNV